MREGEKFLAQDHQVSNTFRNGIREFLPDKQYRDLFHSDFNNDFIGVLDIEISGYNVDSGARRGIVKDALWESRIISISDLDGMNGLFELILHIRR